VLIRNKLYDLFAPDLAGLAAPVYRERGLKRNELVLLRITRPSPPIAARNGNDPPQRERR
jgi:hypothetical protein